MRLLKTALLILLGISFIGLGVNHFLNTGFYAKIMPPYLPAHVFLVQLSGVTEILAGILLLIPATRALGAWGIIAMLVVFLLVHIHMLVHWQDFPSLSYAALLLRLVGQAPLILWAWWFTRPEPNDYQIHGRPIVFKDRSS